MEVVRCLTIAVGGCSGCDIVAGPWMMEGWVASSGRMSRERRRLSFCFESFVNR